jgi:hypothetical protein
MCEHRRDRALAAHDLGCATGQTCSASPVLRLRELYLIATVPACFGTARMTGLTVTSTFGKQQKPRLKSLIVA